MVRPATESPAPRRSPPAGWRVVALALAVWQGCEGAAETADTGVPTITCPANAGQVPGTVTCACLDGYVQDGQSCVPKVACHTAAKYDPATESCTCIAGYTGDGITCEPEVAPGECQDGYEKDASDTCVDIDECLEGRGGCSSSATCANTPGSHTCTCIPGYSGDGISCTKSDDCDDGYAADAGGTCLDVDECALGVDACDPNAACANNDGAYTCTCNAGYLGDGYTCKKDECDPGYSNGGFGPCTDINECTKGTATCGQNRTCVNTQGSYECTCTYPFIEDTADSCACAAGFTLDAASGECDDVDECATDTDGCDALATCKNKWDGFTCECPKGYQVGADGKTCEEKPCDPGYKVNDWGNCQDINECALGTDTCSGHAVCQNTGGSYQCACSSPWVGDGTTCECKPGLTEVDGACVDVDECTSGTDACADQATCTNTQGGYSCVCKPGFLGDGKTCTTKSCDPGLGPDPVTGICANLDECALGTAVCDPNAACKDTSGSYNCACKPGYIGDGKSCAPKTCEPGFVLNAVTFACDDIDECTKDTDGCDANATCTNKPGAWSCRCNAGFQGDGYVCDVSPCDLGYESDAALDCVDVNECLDKTDDCSPYATCTNTAGAFTCACKAGFSGNGKACVCPAGTELTNGACVELDPCALGTDDCDVNAVCAKTGAGTFSCACKAGFTGDGKSCACAPGYEPKNGACADIDECATGAAGCDINATCSNKLGGFLCTCKAGFSGSGSTCGCAAGYEAQNGKCLDVNECAEGLAQCDANATCTNTAGAYTCKCALGYSGDGKTCTEKVCATGYVMNFSTGFCTDVDECATGSAGCDSNATCTNSQGGFSCKCKAGYSGNGTSCVVTPCNPGYEKNAQDQCVDVNECTNGTSDCSPYANCTNTTGSFSCSCKSGFTGNGKTCACASGYEVGSAGTCVDIDECASSLDNCAADASCTNKAPGFTCKCNVGFTGDGKTCAVKTCNAGYKLDASGNCVDINECTEGGNDCAPVGGKCSNTPGSFSCSCLTTFTGDGKSCVDKDECALNTDNCAQICTNTVGGFECSCNPGFKKDLHFCQEINECLDPAAVGCYGECENVAGSFNCWGKGGISSLEDGDNGPYPTLQCAGSVGPDDIYYQTHTTSFFADCRCPQGSGEPGTYFCSAPSGTALDGNRVGTGVSVADHPSGMIEGCATDYVRDEVYYGVTWGDFLDSSRGYIMAVDPTSGNRRIVSGSYLDPAEGVIDVGTGNRFDLIKDMAIGPDGYLYVFEASIPGGGAQPDDTNADLSGRSIYKVDLTNGKRTLVWNQYTEQHPEFVSCPNGNPSVGGYHVVDVQQHGFELDEQGNFILATNDNTAPQAGEGFIRVGKDGQSCTWITRSGTKEGNLLFGVAEGAGSGVTVAAGFDSGFGYRNGVIYATDFLTKKLYKVDVATGKRSILWSGVTPKVGSGPGVGVWNFFYYPYFGVWIAGGNEAGTPLTASLFKPETGETWDWMYKKPDGSTTNVGGQQTTYTNAEWQGPPGVVTNQLRGPILGLQFETLMHRPWCISPTEPNRLLIATDRVGVVKVEVETGNTINFSL